MRFILRPARRSKAGPEIDSDRSAIHAMPKTAYHTASFAAERRRQILQRRQAALEERGEATAARFLAIAAEKVPRASNDEDHDQEDRSCLQLSTLLSGGAGCPVLEMMAAAQEEEILSQSLLRGIKIDSGDLVPDKGDRTITNSYFYDDDADEGDSDETNSILASSDSSLNSYESNPSVSTNTSDQSQTTCPSENFGQSSRSLPCGAKAITKTPSPYRDIRPETALPAFSARSLPTIIVSHDTPKSSEDSSLVYGSASMDCLGLFVDDDDDDWNVTKIVTESGPIAGVKKGKYFLSSLTKSTTPPSPSDTLPNTNPTASPIMSTSTTARSNDASLSPNSEDPNGRFSEVTASLLDVSDLTNPTTFGDLGFGDLPHSNYLSDLEEGQTSLHATEESSESKPAPSEPKRSLLFGCLVVTLLVGAFLCFLSAALVLCNHYFGPLRRNTANSIATESGYKDNFTGPTVTDNIFAGESGESVASGVSAAPTSGPSGAPALQLVQDAIEHD